MKLNLLPPSKLTFVEKILKQSGVTGYESPIGWWRVTTEGDVEGRTTQNLGEFYGHVAEIAFHLADQSCWRLKFKPFKHITVIPTEPIVYTASKYNVWISLDDSRLASQGVEFYKQWLNVTEPKLIVRDEFGGRIYNAVNIAFKETFKN